MQKLVEEGMQCSLDEWRALPHIVSGSHSRLLIMFQQLVEMAESANIQVCLCMPPARVHGDDL